MKTGDRVPGPSLGPCCPACGFEWPPVTPSDLDQFEHDVAHFEGEAGLRNPRGVPGAVGLAAYRALLPALREAHRQRFVALNRRIVDLELDLEAALFDLKISGELINDLKADLAAVEEGRH